MGKSTHPFVEKMNLAKAVHRAMRAGDERAKPTTTKPKDTVRTTVQYGIHAGREMEVSTDHIRHLAQPAKRTVTLTKKPAVVAPQKGVLTALPIPPKDAA